MTRQRRGQGYKMWSRMRPGGPLRKVRGNGTRKRAFKHILAYTRWRVERTGRPEAILWATDSIGQRYITREWPMRSRIWDDTIIHYVAYVVKPGVKGNAE